jgi:probable phosphoglycerate mutase
MTQLALLRHGPTAWNAEGRLQGRTDIPLTAEARAALACLALPAPFHGWRALTSPLRRCCQTAAALGLAARIEPALIEMDWGTYEGRRLAELRAAGGAAFAAAESRGLDFQPPGGESPRQVQARLAPLLARLAATGEPVVAITHRGVIRAVHAAARGWDMTGRPPDRLAAHGALQVFRLAADGTPGVERLDLPLADRGTATKGAPA